MPHYAVIASGAVTRECDCPDGFEPQVTFGGAAADYVETDPSVHVGWTTTDGGKTFVAPVAPPMDLHAYAASARFVKETAGITVGTALIATDRDSQGMITGMWAAAQINPQIQVTFKSGSGFVSIGAAQVSKIAAAVASYVQACFSAEGQIAAGIASGAITTTAAIDAALAALPSSF